jgi:hypothetical protein
MTMMSPEPPLTQSSGISTDARSLLVACLGLALMGFVFFHYWCRCTPSVEPYLVGAQVGPPPAEATPWKDAAADPGPFPPPGPRQVGSVARQPKGPTTCPWAHDRAVDGALPRDYSVNCPHWQRWTHDRASDTPHHPPEPAILEVHVHRASY